MFSSLCTGVLALLFSVGAHRHSGVETVELGPLPDTIDESSGLAVASENSLWTHNDRGSKPEFYEIDMRGRHLRTVELVGVDVVDMEDMARDSRGHLFIGDFGNNDRDRSELFVYRVALDAIRSDRVTPEIIEFDLPDDETHSECHFDFEAMIWRRGRLLLFTRDRCDEPDNELLIYSIPDRPGRYLAEKRGEFAWRNADRRVIITGADLSPSGKTLALLSRDGIHLFLAGDGDDLFAGSRRFFPMKKSKKEGICFVGECGLYISEEWKGKKPGLLLRLDVCQMVSDRLGETPPRDNLQP